MVTIRVLVLNSNQRYITPPLQFVRLERLRNGYLHVEMSLALLSHDQSALFVSLYTMRDLRVLDTILVVYPLRLFL